ncbi:glycosyl hydrolase family 18 protein [Paenibacillus caui]|uniref:glycosyl hydrolase family 18 protein n=1 Tax=Paenibacillus caui TaxID=2873927 RepID=UPI001CA817A3|nr:glycosyl hydrolase family 18 protein [Paenibacillus caui]
MKKPTGKQAAAACAVAVLLVAVLSVIWIWQRGDSGGKQVPVTKYTEAELSAWIADWQWETGTDDLRQLAGGLEELQLFAAYFDQDDNLYFTADFTEALPRIMETAEENKLSRTGLTVVNDRFNADGTTVQKDPELVSRLIATEESRNRHIAQIIDAVSRYGLSGVEIDYEKMNKGDWDKLSLFFQELYERLRQEGKTLRIVLEPGAPVQSVDLPEGPAYVMMAYNLYGGHSGPGPKADFNMIRKLADRMSHVPGERVLAFSAGGFDWAKTGKVTALTEKGAAELAAQNEAAPQRDAASGSVHFDYVDESGVRHTVWYGDEVTISGWIDATLEAGISKVALWRLGELGPETLQHLKGNP